MGLRVVPSRSDAVSGVSRSVAWSARASGGHATAGCRARARGVVGRRTSGRGTACGASGVAPGWGQYPHVIVTSPRVVGADASCDGFPMSAFEDLARRARHPRRAAIRYAQAARRRRVSDRPSASCGTCRVRRGAVKPQRKDPFAPARQSAEIPAPDQPLEIRLRARRSAWPERSRCRATPHRNRATRSHASIDLPTIERLVQR